MDQDPSTTEAPPSGGSSRAAHVALAVLATVFVGVFSIRGASIPGVLLGAVLTAVTAYSGFLYCTGRLSRRSRAARVLALIGIVVLVGFMWERGIERATTPNARGTTLVETLLVTPPWSLASTDEVLYYRYVQAVAAGEPYYDAVVAVLSTANEQRPGTLVLVDSPLSYRPPLMYWLLGALPQNGISFVIATLLIGTVACAAGLWLALRYVPLHLALPAGLLLALRGAWNASGTQMLHTEVWAGAFGLLSVALLVRACERRTPRTGLVIAAAAVALLAATIRELAVAYLLVGLLAMLASRRERELKLWLPWLIALLVWVVLFALHYRAADAAIARAWAQMFTPPISAASVWFHPDFRGLTSTLSRVSAVIMLAYPFSAILIGLGIAGALAAPRTPAARIALGFAVVGGVVITTFVHPAGPIATEPPPGYWSEVILPVTLACMTIAASRLTPPDRAPLTP